MNFIQYDVPCLIQFVITSSVEIWDLHLIEVFFERQTMPFGHVIPVKLSIFRNSQLKWEPTSSNSKNEKYFDYQKIIVAIKFMTLTNFLATVAQYF